MMLALELKPERDFHLTLEEAGTALRENYNPRCITNKD